MLLLSLFVAASARAATFAETPAQMTATVREYFSSTYAEPAGLAPTLHTLGGVDLDDSRNALTLEPLADETRSATARFLYQSEQALKPGALPPSDEDTASALERIHVLTRTPLVGLLTPAQIEQLRSYERQYTDLSSKEAATRLEQRLARMAAALEGRRLGPALKQRPESPLVMAPPQTRPAKAEPATAASRAASTAARRAERELARHRRQTRSASRRPAVEKPVTLPDWLRGPAPLLPAMERAHALADALGAAKGRTARLAAARALADFARTQPKDEEVQRHAARALAEALGHEEDGRAVDETLARLAAFSQFGRIQEIAAAALEEHSSRAALAAVGLASPLPHVRALVAKSGADAAAAPARLAVDALLDAAAGAAAIGRQKQAADAVGRAAKAALAADAAVKLDARRRMLEALQPALRTWERAPYYDALTAAVIELEGGRPAEDPSLVAWRAQFEPNRFRTAQEAPSTPAVWFAPLGRRLKAVASAVAEYWKEIRSFNPGEIED